jgi:hypothetical protein
MTTEESSISDADQTQIPSASEFASEPRTFVKHLARRMDVEIDEALLSNLIERVTGGASREEIMSNLYNIKGEAHSTNKAAAALNFARAGQAGAALIVENVASFAPKDHRAFVLHAFSQILDRNPGEVELARLTHQLEVGSVSRISLLEILNNKAIAEGRHILWDSAKNLQAEGDSDEPGSHNSLVRTAGFRTLSQSSAETMTLCSFTGKHWELAPSMVSRIDEVRSDSWLVSDGFVLTGPKCHISEGHWLIELDLVQPEWASLVVDVVANLAADRLLHLTVHGNVRGSFSFEKLKTHAFPEVRLRVQNAVPGQWLSVQNVKLRKIG